MQKTSRIKKKCLNCKKIFESIPSARQKFCSWNCYVSWVKRKSKTPETKICVVCKRKFKTYNSKKQSCSRKCWNELNRRSHLGRKPWNKGLHGKKYLKHYKGKFPWNKGLTKETDERIRKATEKRVLPKKFNGNRNTKIEKIVQKKLIELGYSNFVMSEYVLGCYPDILFKQEKIAVFCDGDYWHNRPEVKERDKRHNKILMENGWTVLRFWEHEIYDSLDNCIEQITKNISCGGE